jgi:hypothetical protein
MGFMQWHAWRAGVVCAAMLLSACGGGQGEETAGTAAKAQAAFTGNGTWWNPAEPGTGIFFEAQGNVGVITLYVFGNDGKPVWYSGAGSLTANGTGHEFKGMLQRYKGGQSRTSTTPKTPVATEAGEVKVVFQADGARVTVPDRSFDARRFFPPGQGRPANGSQPETGIYWNPVEGGRGYTIEMNDGVALVGVFYYDAAGEPTWNLATVDLERNAGTAGLNSYRNGQTLSGPWRAATGPVADGSMALRFVEACSGSLWFSSMGRTPIRRFGFGSLPAGDECAASKGIALRSVQDGAAQGVARVIAAGTAAYKALAVDGGGNLYALEGNLVRKTTPGGAASPFAGSEQSGYVDATGSDARFSNPTALAVDGAGNVYVADLAPTRIRKITPGGAVSSFSGKPLTLGGVIADGDRATASFSDILHLKADASGYLYVAQGSSIRKVAPDGSVTTLVGQSSPTPPATEGQMQRLWDVTAMAVDAAGNVYVVERDTFVTGKLRKFDNTGRPLPYPGTASGALPVCATTDMVADASNVYLSCKYVLLGFAWQAVFKVTAGGLLSLYTGDLAWTSGPAPEAGGSLVTRPGPMAMDPRDLSLPRLIVKDALAGLVEVLPKP